ncbi:MAG: hypothetical protein HYU75_13400 [Betaproteobacteria bacterium]|nr:hypothetical protein [Betaproteobacteria bacterium]
MVELYTAICVQANRRGVGHRSEIREANLNQCLNLIDFVFRRMDFPVYAPVKLILLPEVFMQGWCRSADNYWEKVGRDIAIQIPGEETDLLAEKARKYKTYIAGTAHELVPGFGSKLPFNCAFIISPEGEVVYKYHKYHPYLPYTGPDDISPHDVYDKYLEVMDGKYGRKKGDVLSCFFPVIDTDIGRIGYIICNDGFYFESSRAMGIQGCELMMRSSGILEPESSPPQQAWEICNRAMAFYNMMFVVACGPGDYIIEKSPRNAAPGQSMIVDFHGALLQHVTYPGEAVTGTAINIEMLRKRRMDPKHNWIPQLRTEVFREIYRKPIYPLNLYDKRIPATERERVDEIPIQRLVREGMLIPPGGSGSR